MRPIWVLRPETVKNSGRKITTIRSSILLLSWETIVPRRGMIRPTWKKMMMMNDDVVEYCCLAYVPLKLQLNSLDRLSQSAKRSGTSQRESWRNRCVLWEQNDSEKKLSFRFLSPLSFSDTHCSCSLVPSLHLLFASLFPSSLLSILSSLSSPSLRFSLLSLLSLFTDRVRARACCSATDPAHYRPQNEQHKPHVALLKRNSERSDQKRQRRREYRSLLHTSLLHLSLLFFLLFSFSYALSSPFSALLFLFSLYSLSGASYIPIASKTIHRILIFFVEPASAIEKAKIGHARMSSTGRRDANVRREKRSSSFFPSLLVLSFSFAFPSLSHFLSFSFCFSLFLSLPPSFPLCVLFSPLIPVVEFIVKTPSGEEKSLYSAIIRASTGNAEIPITTARNSKNTQTSETHRKIRVLFLFLVVCYYLYRWWILSCWEPRREAEQSKRERALR